MRALAILIACLACLLAGLAATPAAAFGHAMGMRPGFPNAFPHGFPHGGAHGDDGHGHHGHQGAGYFDGAYGPTVLSQPGTDATAAPADANAVPELAPAPLCPIIAPAPPRHTGPHIIYIGHRPAAGGPKVIYGNE